MTYALIGLNESLQFELREGSRVVVGRDYNSDMLLVHATVSRAHAEISCTAGCVYVKDLNSANGTFVEGRRVISSEVIVGQILTFGQVEFRLVQNSAGESQSSELRSASENAWGPPSDLVASESATKPMATTILRELPVKQTTDLLAAAMLEHQLHAKDGAAPLSSAKRTERKLALLLEVSKSLSRAVDLDALLETIAAFVFQIMEADWVAILLASEHGVLVPRISRNRQGAESERMASQSVARIVMEERIAVLSLDTAEDKRFNGASIFTQGVRSVMCAPLIGTERSAQGVLYVDNVTSAHSFDDGDLEFLTAFAGVAAAAIENSRLAARIRHDVLVQSNFERYFAPSLAARIASAPDAIKLGGDRRVVAVLFSDIRGFTAMAESMNPESVANLLSEYFTAMVDCVFRHGGTLDKFIGDAILAQWGAPIGAADDADRCLAAAIDMMRELASLNACWNEQGRLSLQIGIGLNYGEVFAGNIGSERRLEFTVIGDSVNVASRLCSNAAAGQILLTQDFLHALPAPPNVCEHVPMRLKGKSQLVTVYSVAAEVTA